LVPNQLSNSDPRRPIELTAARLNAFVYLRVSTGRQAETDLSIPDQRRQVEAWCAARGHIIIDEFVEPGASATDDKRPEFQRMIDRATDGENSIDLIVVHSYSRFFRDSFKLEFYLRKLAKSGVKLVSITQEFNDDADPAQAMMRKVVALFDEYQSKENAKHVLRAMKENARQGFWNGARPPYGYNAVAVEQRGARIKKRLEIDVVEAELVRLVFRLVLEGHEGSGPKGIKAIASWLNANGYRTRSGATWAIGPLHVMLTNTVYAGVARFNITDARSRTRKSEAEHVTSPAPIIIDPPLFERVQALLKSRNPRVSPPRVVSGPILLTGLAHCATCSGAMTLRTGTSKTGKVHKYYACSTCVRQGKTVCKGRSIAMSKLDELVTGHLIDRLLAPDRLQALLVSVAARRAARAVAVDDRIAGLQARADEADERLRRLYKMVEDGVAAMDDLLKDRIVALKADREAAYAALDRARSTNRAPIVIPGDKIAAFGRLMRERLTAGDIVFRKAYLGAIVDRVEVDDHQIRICGRKDILEQAVLANGGPIPGVRSFVRRWRPVGN
jgi:DNA invertase Pin-like site-specific DNA recombinase